MKRTTFIAEAGVNWISMREALTYIRNAKESGFDLVKFQLYDSGVLSKIESPDIAEKLNHRMLSLSDARILVGEGNAVGIPVFFTAMYPRGVDIARKAGAKHLKIRCSDRSNEAIWEKARKWKGTVYYSTTDVFEGRTNTRIPLYCVPKYPAIPSDYDGIFLRSIRNRIGVSLHAPDPAFVVELSSLGPPAIEMHVRLDQNPDVIDAAVSFPFSETQRVIEECRNAHAAVDG